MLVFCFLRDFLTFLPTRVCMMIQTVTAWNWTIREAQNPASLQATGENWTLGNRLFKAFFSPKEQWLHADSVLQRQEDETDWLCFCRNGKQLLSLVLTSSHSVLTGGHHSDGTRGFSSPQSSLQEPFTHVSNRPSAQTPSYLPGTFELKTCCVIFHHILCWRYKVSGLLFLMFLLMLLRQILTDAVAACT